MQPSQPSLPLCFHDWQTHEIVQITLDSIHSFEPKHDRRRGDYTLIKLNISKMPAVKVQESCDLIANTLLIIDPVQAHVIFKQCARPVKG